MDLVSVLSLVPKIELPLLSVNCYLISGRMRTEMAG